MTVPVNADAKPSERRSRKTTSSSTARSSSTATQAYLRDYDVAIDVPATRPDESGTYIAARHRYRFTHFTAVHVTSTVGDEVWRKSWNDSFIDYRAWNWHAGQSDSGGACSLAGAYPNGGDR